MMTIDNIITAVGYTMLMLGVSSYYWFQGRQKGINDTVAVMKKFEPEATFRLKSTLERMTTNDTDTKQ
jgi:hypothetical protein